MEGAEAEAILDGDRETAVALLIRVGELIEANERLEARLAELERRLKRSSGNSSLPPSQDPPSAPRPRRPGSGRTRSGQPGHEGRHRRLVPPERVDEIVEHWPRRCHSCAHEFGELERVDVGAAVAAAGRWAAADRGAGDRAPAARCALSRVRQPDPRRASPARRRGRRSARGCRPRW
jgi:Family of unknown function (DUF6444)